MFGYGTVWLVTVGGWNYRDMYDHITSVNSENWWLELPICKGHGRVRIVGWNWLDFCEGMATNMASENWWLELPRNVRSRHQCGQ